jgi:MFS family permease
MSRAILTAIVFILSKVPAGRWLGYNVICWGVATACTAAATDYHTLLVARIFLGIFEAPVVPCLVLISSQWYTKVEQGPRFAIWYCGLGAGQIIGGMLSFGFQHVASTAFQSWKIMFVVLGGSTFILGLATLFLPECPSQASFLSDHEKAVLSARLPNPETAGTNKKFHLRDMLDILRRPDLPLLALMTILVSKASLPWLSFRIDSMLNSPSLACHQAL